MKLEMDLEKKKFTREDGQEIEYYVLKRKLVDGTFIEIPVKTDKAKMILLSLTVEKYNNK